MYDKIHEHVKNINHQSLVMCDAVCLVAYYSLLLFIFALFSEPSWFNAANTFCANCREALLVFIILPHISKVNDLHDELCHCLSNYDPTLLLNSNKIHQSVHILRLTHIASIDRPLTLYILGILYTCNNEITFEVFLKYLLIYRSNFS